MPPEESRQKKDRGILLQSPCTWQFQKKQPHPVLSDTKKSCNIRFLTEITGFRFQKPTNKILSVNKHKY